MTDDGKRISPVYSRRNFLKSVGAAGVTLGLGGGANAKPGKVRGSSGYENLAVGISNPQRSRSIKSEIINRLGDVEISENSGLGYMKVETSGKYSRKDLQDLSETLGVKYVELDSEVSMNLQADVSDPKLSDQYVPQQVNAPKIWEKTLGSNDVSIGFVDQGVKYDHPDLKENYVDGKDFVDDDADPYPEKLGSDTKSEWHGTHLAGVAAAKINNQKGISGIGNSGILSARALNEKGQGSVTQLADGIKWAADKGAKVINLGVGSSSDSETMRNAVKKASKKGSLLVGSVGSAGSQGIDYPARYSEVFAVSSLKKDGSFSQQSNYGKGVDISAPGQNVLSTWVDSSYNKITGDSVSSSVVSGAAGLAYALTNLSSPEEMRQYLRNNAEDIGLPETKQGAGRVNLRKRCADCGNDSKITETVKSSLSSSWDSECWKWEWEQDGPTELVIELNGPKDADFDLYTKNGGCPSVSWWNSEFDKRSTGPDSEEKIVINDTRTDSGLKNVNILVDSYSGSGKYELKITEIVETI